MPPTINVIVVVETFVAFIIAVTLHEVAHAAVATLLGDGTAASRGRMALAPARQLTPIGTIVGLLFSFGIFGVPGGLGWGKPFELDARRMRVGPNLGTVLVAVAGPLVNLVLAAALSAGLQLQPAFHALGMAEGACLSPDSFLTGVSLQACLGSAQPGYALRIEQFVFILVVTNILVALINVIPLYPLDGYHVLFALLPTGPAIRYRNWAPYMELLLLVIFFVVPLMCEFLRLPLVSPGSWLEGWAMQAASMGTRGAYDFSLLL